jgi:putative FmdB family regulatory protein
MPLYEYQCQSCHERFERIQKFSDPPADVCPKCGAGPVKKLPSSPAIQFKGSGWYVTDYARKSGDAAKTSETKSSESSSDSTSGGKSTTEPSAPSTSADTSTKKD